MTKKTSPAYRASKEETIPINKLHPYPTDRRKAEPATEVLLKSVGCAAILPIQLYTAADAKCHHITAAELGA